MTVTADEWRNRSLNGEVCGIIFCPNPPINQCLKCNLHYCYEHFRLHMHELSEDKIKEEAEGLSKEIGSKVIIKIEKVLTKQLAKIV